MRCGRNEKNRLGDRRDTARTGLSEYRQSDRQADRRMNLNSVVSRYKRQQGTNHDGYIRKGYSFNPISVKATVDDNTRFKEINRVFFVKKRSKALIY